MKKLLFSFFVIGSYVTNFSQKCKIDFENLILPQAETFYNGSDNAGGFSSGNLGSNNVFFSNAYTTYQGGYYWNGFAYSNMTDVTTVGIENQYSSFAGSGANSSEKYAIFYPDGLITFGENIQIDSLKITNTTYTALSIRDGDSYGKKFGNSTNANGNIDGTNGEDFFKVWVIGMNDQLEHTDSVEFYLADFRFANNNLDYIVNTWKNVDLSSFGWIKHLTFRFESSDIDMVYGFINTPTYLALDDLHFTKTLNIKEENLESISIYPNPVSEILTISGKSGKISIENVSGKIIYEANYNQQKCIDFTSFDSGIYFVTIENNGTKFNKKIVK